MQPEIDTQVITVTPEAAQAVQDLLDKRNLPGYALRVYVAGQTCRGFAFGLALDKEARQGDTAFQSEGINVLIDNQSLEYLRGAVIEFINDPQQGTGFVIHSPINDQLSEANGCGSGCASCGA